MALSPKQELCSSTNDQTHNRNQNFTNRNMKECVKSHTDEEREGMRLSLVCEHVAPSSSVFSPPPLALMYISLSMGLILIYSPSIN